MVDLRSDTVTRPTSQMRQAMAEALVGDDVYGDDPTANQLEQEVADFFGKEAAVFVPTGSMSNQIALRVHAKSGDRIVIDEGAHILRNEGGAAASLSGITCHTLAGNRGIFTVDQVDDALPPDHRFTPVHLASPARLLCVEHTHNGGGGSLWSLDALREVAELARARGLAAHMDGARIWNALAVTGNRPSDVVSAYDTVSVCFSKGLGAPIGSALVGSRDHIARARRYKQMFGGGIRQAGVIAAGALFGFRHHRDRLVADHQRAASFAQAVSVVDGIHLDVSTVETNIVRFRLSGISAAAFVDALHERGVWVLASGADGVRAVFHLDVDDDGVRHAVGAVQDVMAGVRVG